MVSRIVQRISLEGAEDVQAKLKKTGEVGAKALAATNRTIEDSNSGLGKYGNVFAGLNGKTEESRESIERVKRLVETIKPAAEKAGLELGNIGEFGRIGRGGVIALAAAIGTTLVAAIERAGDAARDQAQRLGTFTGSAQKGVETYNALKKTATELEIPSSGLAPAFEQLLRANQRSGAGFGDEGLQDVLTTLFKGANADRVPLEKSQEGITALLGGLREQGQLSPQLAKPAQELFPTLMKRLIEDLQKSFPDQITFSTPQVLKSLQHIGPQIAKDLEATKEAFPNSIEDSLNKLKSSASNLGDSLNGTTIIAKVLDGAASFLDTLAGGINRVKKSAANSPVPGAEVTLDQANKIRERRGVEPVQGQQQYDFLRRPASTVADEPTAFSRFWSWLGSVKAAPYEPEGTQPHGSIAESAPEKQERAGESAEKLGDALSGAADKAKSAEQTFDEFNKKGAEQLGVIASKLASAQSRIDYEHKPEELDIKLGRDQLAVESAALARRSAQIGLTDAEKAKRTAALAPETARENVEDAHVNENRARLAFLQSVGQDTEGSIDEARVLQDQQLAASRAYDRAITASKRAEIESKYAYLEPQKAELAGKKAQIDVRSANYVEQDATLTLAKDKQGRQLSADVAGLRYAQAQLDEQQKIAKSGDLSVRLLDTILAVLKGAKGSENLNSSDALKDSAGKLGDAASKIGESARQGASQYEQTARETGLRTVEGDRLVREESGKSAEVTSPDLQNQRNIGEWEREQQGRFSKSIVDQDGLPALPQAPGIDGTPAGAIRHGYYDENGQFVQSGPATPGGFGAPSPISFPQVPLPQPRPPEADQQQQGALPDTQQLASLGSAFQSFIESIAATLNNAKGQNTNVGPDTQGIGIRGEGQGDASKDVADLGDSAGKADSALNDLTASFEGAANSIKSDSNKPEPVHAATGGLITGPGTRTSDSIPTMLSRDEFVVNADAAQKHLGLLNGLNAGKEIGFKHLAIGGPVGVMGDIGMPSITAPSIVGNANSGLDLSHYGTVDLTTDHGDHRVITDEDTMSSLKRSANQQKRYSTGKSPRWNGSRGQ